MRSGHLLTLLILAGLVFGILVGLCLHDPAYDPADPVTHETHAHATALHIFDFLGSTVFMGLLKMLIIPLIISSVVVGVTSVGDFSKLGRIGARTLVYYFATMFVAVVIGLAMVTTVRPGSKMTAVQPKYVPPESVGATAQKGLVGVVENLVGQMIPTNIIEAMAEGRPLGVITFSIFFGVVVTLIGARARIIIDLFEAVFAVLMKMVHAIMWVAPVGVFALLAWTVARFDPSVFFKAIGLYMIVVLAGLAIHGLIVLPLLLWIFARENPVLYLFKLRQAMITALATDSSSATLPVTIECVTEQAGVSKRSAGFVLPLGSTINMDGTALYEAVAVVFLAQAFGVALGPTELVLVAITATLAAVGAASIPSAGLVTMVLVIDAVNHSLGDSGAGRIPIEGIGLIIGVDRILDMFRTTVNVWGDAVGAKIIDRLDAS
jgi:Na+/H+-dicarboxylate symporter